MPRFVGALKSRPTNAPLQWHTVAMAGQRRFYVAPLLAASLFLSCIHSAWAAEAAIAVPKSATHSSAALVKAYLDAVQTHKVESIEALFDLTGLSAGARAGFHEHLAQDLNEHISKTTLVDPDRTSPRNTPSITLISGSLS